MKNEKISEAIKIIQKAIQSGISVKQAAKKNGKERDFVSHLITGIKNRNYFSDVPAEEKQELFDLYNEYLESKKVNYNKNDNKVITKEKKQSGLINLNDNDIYEGLSKEEIEEELYDAYKDDAYDERSKSTIARDTEEEVEMFSGLKVKKITGYKYHIIVRGEDDLIGEFTREEMDFIYRLYSNMGGAGLTVRSVSRHFPTLTYRDFKRLLRAFNITKSSIPVAPHIIEEGTEDEIRNLIFLHKEKNVLKKLEDDRSVYLEKHLKETLEELCEIKIKIKDVRQYLSDINFDDIEPFYIEEKKINGEKALMIYIADQHVGAKTLEDSIYLNEYNEKEFNSRMNATLQKIKDIYNIFGRFEKIYVCNLGDPVDGYNNQTTRGGHSLPQNLNNKEQFRVYTNAMIKFFETLHKMDIANEIEYQCVGDDNHSGDIGYIANKALELYLGQRFPEMKVKIFEKVIEHFTYGDHTFILTHGKDKIDMKSGFPLNLDNKSEAYFLAYIDNLRLNNKNMHVVIADQHQSLTQYSKRFRWKRVLSMYGSSKWIQTNFGNTRAGLDYEVVSKNNNDVFEGRVWF